MRELLETWISLPVTTQTLIAAFIMRELVKIIRPLVQNRIDGAGVHRFLIFLAGLAAIFNDLAGLGIDSSGVVGQLSLWATATLAAIGWNEMAKKQKENLLRDAMQQRGGPDG